MPAPRAVDSDIDPTAPAPAADGALPRLVVPLAACAIAFAVFPGTPRFSAGLVASLIARGLLAGLVAGLLARPTDAGPRIALPAALGGALAGVALLVSVREPGAALWLLAGVALAAATAIGTAWLRRRAGRTLAIGVALALLAACQLWTLGLLGGPYAPLLEERQVTYARAIEPERYAFDGELYLRTRALMRQGVPYYAAFQRAWSEDARFAGPIRTPLSFREPGLFLLWRLLPGASATALLGWFIVFGLAVAVAGWWLAATFVSDGIALLAPILLSTFFAWFVLGAHSWFTFAEVWAGGVMVIALALLVRGRWMASALALVAAVAMRELAIVYVPAWVIAGLWAAPRRPRLAGLLVATLGASVPIALHLAMAPAAGGGDPLALATWLHSTGLPRLVRSLAHGMELMPFGPRSAPWIALVSLGGVLALRDGRLRAGLAAALVAPALFLLAISANRFDYYWGALLTPVVLACLPLAFARVGPAEPASAARGARG